MPSLPAHAAPRGAARRAARTSAPHLDTARARTNHAGARTAPLTAPSSAARTPMPRRRAPWSARHSRPHRGQARGGAAAHTARACAPPRVSALRRQHRQRHPCRLARQRRHDTHAPTTTTAFLRQATTSTLPTQSSEQRASRRRAHGVGARFAAACGPPLARLYRRADFASTLLGASTKPGLHRHARRGFTHSDITPGSQLPSSSTRHTPATSRPRAPLPRAACAYARRRWRPLSTSATAAYLASSTRTFVAEGGTFDVGYGRLPRVIQTHRRRVAPHIERFALGPPGHFPPLSCLVPSPPAMRERARRAAPEQ